ncbi:hypothetical protein Dimus_006159 [Dionaea muscipula]
MDFCPTCGNLLQYDTARLFCRACPYVYPIKNETKIRRAIPLPKKEEAPKPNKERKVTCPKCSRDKPEYHEEQIESADEPNATFYRCPECSHEWPHEDA